MFPEGLKQVWNMRARNNLHNQKKIMYFQEPPQHAGGLPPPAPGLVGPIDLGYNATKMRVWHGGVVKIHRVVK